MAVRGGHVVEVFPASSSKWAQPLNAVERARLLHAAESVGRIETRQGTDATLNGTGFVVAQGVIATNCHVLREIAQQSAGGAWALKPGLLEIDFSDSSMHEPVHEYTIQSIAGYPESQFLDVALLRVAPTSKTGGRPLPGPLPVTRTIIQRQWQTDQLLIDVIGYPDLDNLVGDQMTQNMFRRVRESGDYAKLLSPGAVTGVDTHGRLDFLNHVASTHPGESGAPVVDRETGAVVGIHYCCSSTDVPQSMSPLACSSQLLSDRDNNEALSSWTVVADSVLGPLLKDVAAGSLFFTRPAGRPASRGGEASTRRQALP